MRKLEAQSQAEAHRLEAHAAAESQRIRHEADMADLRQSEQTAAAYQSHPALLRLRELEALQGPRQDRQRPHLHRLRQAPAGH